MKNILLILLICSYTTVFSQEKSMDFHGHWRFCHKDFGYSELLITDSLIDWMSEETFAFSPTHYSLKNDLIVNDLNGDTLDYQINEDDQMIINWFDNNDTLERMSDSLLTFYDFNCSRKMNSRQFNTFLYHQFMGRKAKYQYYCTPPIVHEIDATPHSLGDLNITDTLFNLDSNHAYLLDFDYQLIEHKYEQKLSPKLLGLQYSKDSSDVLLTIQQDELCYDIFSESVHLDKNGQLQLIIRSLGTPCKERCLINYYFHINRRDIEITDINLNNEKVKITGANTK